MNQLENPMFEIGTLLEGYREKEKLELSGHLVYEISLLLHDYKEKTSTD